MLGLNVSIMSMFGLVALTGVVVNDSLITLVLVPTAYMILDDVGRTLRWIFGVREPAATHWRGQGRVT